MSKSKHAKPDEFQKEQIRHLKKEVRRKDQEIRQLQKELGYSQNKDISKKQSKKQYFDEQDCTQCGKGSLITLDFGIRKITRCNLCDYQKVSK